MDRTEIEQTMSDLLDAADKLQCLIADVQGIALRVRAQIDDDTPSEPVDSTE